MLNTKTHIYLSAITGEAIEKGLMKTLHRAGFQFDSTNSESNVKTACSVFYISPALNEKEKSMQAEEHFNTVLELAKVNPQYKSFFWMPEIVNISSSSTRENNFITRLQNNLTNNMILSTVPYAIQFVEDIRLILEERPKTILDTTPTDIFIICSQVDEQEVQRIFTILSDIVKLVKLIIVQDNDIDYEEFASQQMNVSKISVIYYKNGADWAIPFTQQIWKKVGGAAAKSPMLLLGDIENEANVGKKFVAPRVTSMVMQRELIPLEIKIQFDAVNESR